MNGRKRGWGSWICLLYNPTPNPRGGEGLVECYNPLGESEDVKGSLKLEGLGGWKGEGVGQLDMLSV